MVAEKALERAVVAAQNSRDDTSRVSLTSQDIHPLVRAGARGLIGYHRQENPVIAASWGTPSVVFDEIANQLSVYHGRAIAEDMATALVEHAQDHALSFRGRHPSNVIAVKLEVADTDPEAQFETGAIETQRIDGKTGRADVAGSSGQEVRLTASGTATTSNRADVGAIFAHVRIKSLWIKFEAPDREELQGIAEQMALNAMAAMAEGGMSAAEIEAVLAKLGDLAAADLLPPQLVQAIQKLGQIQVLASGGELNAEARALLAETAQEFMEIVEQALEEGTIQPAMLEVALTALQEISELHNLGDVIPARAISALRQDVMIAVLSEKLGVIAGTLDAAGQETIQAMIDALHDNEGALLVEQLDDMKVALAAMDIPQAQIDGLDIDGLKTIVTQNMSLQEKLNMFADIGAQDLMDLLQELSAMDADSLPPELAELLEKLDIEGLSLDEIKEALKGEGPHAEALQQMILALNNPDIQAALPQDALNSVNQFMARHEGLVDAVTTAAVVAQLSQGIAVLDPASPEATQIQEIITRLEKGDSIQDMDPVIIEQIVREMGDAAPSELIAAVEKSADIIRDAHAEPVVIGADTQAALNALVVSGDLDVATQTLIEDMLADPTRVDPAELEKVIEALGDKVPPELKALQEAPTVVNPPPAEPPAAEGEPFDIPDNTPEPVDLVADNDDTPADPHEGPGQDTPAPVPDPAPSYVPVADPGRTPDNTQPSRAVGLEAVGGGSAGDAPSSQSSITLTTADNGVVMVALLSERQPEMMVQAQQTQNVINQIVQNAGKNPSATDKAIIESAAQLLAVQKMLAAGKPVSPENIVQALNAFDTAINKLPVGEARTALENQRQTFVKEVGGTPGLPPALKEGPGGGNCLPGQCHCNDNFNGASFKQNGDRVEVALQDGTKVTMSLHEAKEAIHQDIANREIDNKAWKDMVDKHGGNELAAYEHLQSEQRKENELVRVIEERHKPIDIDSKKGDDAIRRMREEMDKGKKSTGGGPTKHFGHVCGAGCNHNHDEGHKPLPAGEGKAKEMKIAPSSEGGAPTRRTGFQGTAKTPGPKAI
jgi:hypothetical protein